MSRALRLTPLLLVGALLVSPVLAGDEKVDESATPRIVCIAFTKSGDAASGKLEAAFLAKMRTTYAAHNVLFLTADVTSAATTHQARLLLNALGLSEVWTANTKKPGRVVLVDGEWSTVRTTLTATTTETEAKKAFDAALKPQETDEEGDDEEDK